MDKECYRCGMVKFIPPNHLECLVDGHCVRVFDLDVESAMGKLYENCGFVKRDSDIFRKVLK